MSETTKPKDDESLVAAPYLDELIKINQKALEEAREKDKKNRDVIRIDYYLYYKFPYATGSRKPVPEKEFAMIAKRARNYLLSRIAGASLLSLASLGGVVYGGDTVISL